MPYKLEELRKSELGFCIPKPGQVWHWEPMKSHASTRLVVLEVEINSDNEVHVKAARPKGLGREPEGRPTWNTLSRWIEACVLVDSSEEDN